MEPLADRGVILVTGATGFVGSALVDRLARDNVRTRACVRRGNITLPTGAQKVLIEGLGANQDWTEALRGVEVVVHAAARAHIMDDRAADPLAEFRRVNVDGTLQLARHAAARGVRRFVFVSSIKVNGETTEWGRPFRADDTPAPVDPYGRSKMEAEQGLLQLATQTSMEVVIVRPPLVYGPGVKANFAALVRAIKRGWPLPLGGIKNQRSLVGLDNLVDLIVVTIAHPRAPGQIFLVSDGTDLSTPGLAREIAASMGRHIRLVPVPPWMLQTAARLAGRPQVAQRLCGNLQIDLTKARELLDWAPPVSIQEGMKRATAPL